jgi:hypothetical protein
MIPMARTRRPATEFSMAKSGSFGLVIALLAASCVLGCGGARKNTGPAPDPAAEQDPGIAAADMIPRAVLESAEFTTAVDEQRYVATAEVRTEFSPTEPKICLVGKLKRVPTQARIEVRWFREADPKPMLVSQINGSETFSFVATLRPLGPKFIPGPYTARIFVDEREVGGGPFTVLGVPPTDEGPLASGLALSKEVGGKMKPKRPGDEFKSGTARLFATFDVRGAQEGSSASVRWVRNGAVFHEQEVEVAPEGRFGAELSAPNGIPDGSYSVEVTVDGGDEATAGFTIGDPASGPRVDRLELGRALGDDNLPDVEVTTFSRRDDAIRCGLRFLDLPAGSEIAVLWLALAEDGTTVLMHTTGNAVPDGGFEPGSYKVVVVVSGETLAETGFAVE